MSTAKTILGLFGLLVIQGLVMMFFFGNPFSLPALEKKVEVKAGERAAVSKEIPTFEVASAAPTTLQTVEDEPPTPIVVEEGLSTEDIPIEEAPFIEKTGGEGMVEERLAGNDGQIPEEVVDRCMHFFPKTLDEEMRAKEKQGPAKAGFSIKFDGLESPWSVMLAERLAGEPLDFTLEGVSEDVIVKTDGGEVSPTGDNSWRWTGPEEPGIFCIHIEDPENDNLMCLHAAILKPYHGEAAIGSYKIGEYKDEPYRGSERYLRPRGFIELTEENQSMWVSPHFQLKQFACKQDGGFPKYMRLETRLLLKLELLIEGLEDKGVSTDSLYILSGFRTPWYNKAIGNKTYYSRHLFGDAADLLVDTNQDGNMDDIDGSGSVTGNDAQILYNVVGEITGIHKHLVGGLGFYDTKNYRNPFIHTDTRGYPARWKK